MKTSIFSIITLVQAQNLLNNDIDTIDSSAQRHLWQQSNMVNQMLEHEFPLKKDMWHYMWRYGCYCHRDDSHMASSSNGYHGPGLDALDNLCRTMIRSQSCLQDEYDRKFSKDDVEGRTYPWYIDEDTNQIVCNKKKWPEWAGAEHNEFRLKNCLIEKEFVESFIGLIKSGYQQNTDWIKMGNKQYALTCVPSTRTGKGNGGDDCCGTGIHRKPYNSAVVQCCDEEIKAIGTC